MIDEKGVAMFYLTRDGVCFRCFENRNAAIRKLMILREMWPDTNYGMVYEPASASAYA